jgi:hypothetical protein
VGLSPFTTTVSNLCLTEIPFALATMLFMRFNSQEEDSRVSRLLAALFAAVAYLLRTAGIALLAAWVGEAVFRLQYKKACLRLTFALIPVLAWHAYVLDVESSTSYLHPAYTYQRADYLFYNVSYARNLSYQDPLRPERGKASFGDVIARFRNNLTRMPTTLGESVSTQQEYWPLLLEWVLKPVKNLPGTWRILKTRPEALATLLGILVLAGVLLQFIRGSLLIPLYTTAFLLVVCLNPWPKPHWGRYWMPLAPFLALALVECLSAIRRYVSEIPLGHMKSVGSIVLPAVIGLILTVQVFALYDLYARSTGDVVSYDRHGQPTRYRLFSYGNEYRALDQGLDWLRARAKPADIIATPLPHWAYLRIGLKAVMPPAERDLGKMQEFLDSVPATYVVVAQSGVDHTRDYTLPLLQGAPSRWAHVYGTPDGGLDVYQRIHSPGSVAESR